jgi:hypothetical protein
MDRHEVVAPPQPQGRKEAGNAEHVIEMAVRQQEPVEPSESGTAPKQLALRTLPAIDHDAMAAGFHQKARMVAVGRWDTCRSSEKSEIEHDRKMISSVSVEACHGTSVQANYIFYE